MSDLFISSSSGGCYSGLGEFLPKWKTASSYGAAVLESVYYQFDRGGWYLSNSREHSRGCRVYYFSSASHRAQCCDVCDCHKLAIVHWQHVLCSFQTREHYIPEWLLLRYPII